MSEPNILVESEAPHRLNSNAFTLTVRQQPERAKVFHGPQQREKDRKPVDPPPIIQLQIIDPTDPAQNYLQSPYFFMCCNLVDADSPQSGQGIAEPTSEDADPSSQASLSGMLVSSLHRLKDTNNSDGGFFVFPDISVRVEGTFRLRFSLFEMVKDARPHVLFIKSIVTEKFTVHNQRNFPGMLESTYLSRSFSDQGVRLRVRKEPRILGKRPAQSAEMPNPSQESSSRSASRQESSGLQSPLEQTGNFPSTYGETFPVQAPNAQYQAFVGYPQRDVPPGNRPSFPAQEYQPFLGYPQNFQSDQQRFPQGFTGHDVRQWQGGYAQDQFARQSQYLVEGSNASDIYRTSMNLPNTQAMQYQAPVPPDRQLTSTGPPLQQTSHGSRQMSGGELGGFHQGSYGSRDNAETPFNVGLGPEPYQQLPSRMLPPPNQQYGGSTMGTDSQVNQPTSGAQQGTQQTRGMPSQQLGFDPQYQGHYQGHPSYR